MLVDNEDEREGYTGMMIQDPVKLVHIDIDLIVVGSTFIAEQQDTHTEEMRLLCIICNLSLVPENQ